MAIITATGNKQQQNLPHLDLYKSTFILQDQFGFCHLPNAKGKWKHLVISKFLFSESLVPLEQDKANVCAGEVCMGIHCHLLCLHARRPRFKFLLCQRFSLVRSNWNPFSTGDKGQGIGVEQRTVQSHRSLCASHQHLLQSLPSLILLKQSVHTKPVL